MLSSSSKAATSLREGGRQRVLSPVPSLPSLPAVASPIQPASERCQTVCQAFVPKKKKFPFRPDEVGPERPRITPPPPPPEKLTPLPDTSESKLISKTEIAAFIQRDDLMDQLYRWSVAEAGQNGVRKFGLPMNVEPFYWNENLWGFKVSIFKEGQQLADLGVMMDKEIVKKHEWVGRGDDGFPILEGKVDEVVGQNFEIWKLCARPVSEELRQTIRLYCTALVTALNRYYAFGSVFVDDAQ